MLAQAFAWGIGKGCKRRWLKANGHGSLGQRPRYAGKQGFFLVEGHIHDAPPSKMNRAFGQKTFLRSQYLGRCPRLP
jgi:hypothetical protein